MGIKNLIKLLNSKVTNGIREMPIAKYESRIIAMNASVTMYQCLVAATFFSKNNKANIFGRKGRQTGHITGLLYKNIKFIEQGIKPVWVFDGNHHKRKRKEQEVSEKQMKEEQEELEEAEEIKDIQNIVRKRKRILEITPAMERDAKELFQFLGLPIVEAPGEAEAQSAILCREKMVDAMATEDLDSLIYQPNLMLRKFKNEKTPVIEYEYEEIIKELGLSSSQLVDLAILTGTDYCPSIKGIGPVKAFNLIQKHQTLEASIKEISEIISPSTKKLKYFIPDDYNFLEAREKFTHPNVLPSEEITLSFFPPNFDSLHKFLKKGKFLPEKRVDSAMKRLREKKAKPTEKDDDIPDFLDT